MALPGPIADPETGPEHVFANMICDGSESNLLLCPVGGVGETEATIGDVSVQCAGMLVTILSLSSQFLLYQYTLYKFSNS